MLTLKLIYTNNTSKEIYYNDDSYPYLISGKNLDDSSNIKLIKIFNETNYVPRAIYLNDFNTTNCPNLTQISIFVYYYFRFDSNTCNNNKLLITHCGTSDIVTNYFFYDHSPNFNIEYNVHDEEITNTDIPYSPTKSPTMSPTPTKSPTITVTPTINSTGTVSSTSTKPSVLFKTKEIIAKLKYQINHAFLNIQKINKVLTTNRPVQVETNLKDYKISNKTIKDYYIELLKTLSKSLQDGLLTNEESANIKLELNNIQNVLNIIDNIDKSINSNKLINLDTLNSVKEVFNEDLSKVFNVGRIDPYEKDSINELLRLLYDLRDELPEDIQNLIRELSNKINIYKQDGIFTIDEIQNIFSLIDNIYSSSSIYFEAQEKIIEQNNIINNVQNDINNKIDDINDKLDNNFGLDILYYEVYANDLNNGILLASNKPETMDLAKNELDIFNGKRIKKDIEGYSIRINPQESYFINHQTDNWKYDNPYNLCYNDNINGSYCQILNLFVKIYQKNGDEYKSLSYINNKYCIDIDKDNKYLFSLPNKYNTKSIATLNVNYDDSFIQAGRVNCIPNSDRYDNFIKDYYESCLPNHEECKTNRTELISLKNYGNEFTYFNIPIRFNRNDIPKNYYDYISIGNTDLIYGNSIINRSKVKFKLNFHKDYNTIEKNIEFYDGNLSEAEQFMTDVKGSLLPNEYQGVEYLESTGTGQYINTNIKVANGDIFTVDILIKYDKTSVRRLIGVNGGARAYFGVDTSNKFDTSSCLRNFIDVDISNINRIRMAVDTVNLEVRAKVNDLEESVYEHTLNQLVSNTPFYLFKFMEGYNGKGVYIYDVKLIKNDEVQHLIPCYRKSDNVAGMYDVVTGTFFTNAGTGSFIVGEDYKYTNEDYQYTDIDINNYLFKLNNNIFDLKYKENNTVTGFDGNFNPIFDITLSKCTHDFICLIPYIDNIDNKISIRISNSNSVIISDTIQLSIDNINRYPDGYTDCIIDCELDKEQHLPVYDLCYTYHLLNINEEKYWLLSFGIIFKPNHINDSLMIQNCDLSGITLEILDTYYVINDDLYVVKGKNFIYNFKNNKYYNVKLNNDDNRYWYQKLPILHSDKIYSETVDPYLCRIDKNSPWEKFNYFTTSEISPINFFTEFNDIDNHLNTKRYNGDYYSYFTFKDWYELDDLHLNKNLTLNVACDNRVIKYKIIYNDYFNFYYLDDGIINVCNGWYEIHTKNEGQIGVFHNYSEQNGQITQNCCDLFFINGNNNNKINNIFENTTYLKTIGGSKISDIYFGDINDKNIKLKECEIDIRNNEHNSLDIYISQNQDNKLLFDITPKYDDNYLEQIKTSADRTDRNNINYYDIQNNVTWENYYSGIKYSYLFLEDRMGSTGINKNGNYIKFPIDNTYKYNNDIEIVINTIPPEVIPSVNTSGTSKSQ